MLGPPRPVAAFIAVCALALWGLPPAAWTPVQVLSSAIGVGALLPQILLNFRQGSTGEWSAITAGLSTAGNGLRVFTTVQLTGDPVLMVVRGRPGDPAAAGPRAASSRVDSAKA